MVSKVRVLAVDDEPMNLELLDRSLHRNYDVLLAESPASALDMLARYPDIAIILSDYRMPGMNGAELLSESMHLNPLAKRVVITGYADADSIIDAINKGQIHYLIKKPWSHQDLNRVLEQLCRVHMLEHENRSLLDQLRSANAKLREHEAQAALGAPGELPAGSVAASERREVERDLQRRSLRDGLTGLYNHRSLQERLAEEVARATRYRHPLSLLLCDIDRFRQLNAERGYRVGDEVLCCAADVLRCRTPNEGLRDCDVVARFGGEEFAILLPETAKEGATVTAGRLREAFEATDFPHVGRLTMSVGVVSYPVDGANQHELVRAAEQALRRAKVRGRNKVHAAGADEETTGPHFDAQTTGVHQAVRLPGIVFQDELPRGEAALFPTYHDQLLGITEALETDRALNCLYVDLSALRRVDLEYGVHKHAEVFLTAGRLIDALRGDRLRSDDMVCRTEDDDAYLCFLSAARSSSPGTRMDDLETIAQRIQTTLEGELAETVRDLIHDYPRVTVGYARVLNNSMIRPERLIHRLVTEAMESAALMKQRTTLRDKALLQEIILTESLTSVYQPIVHLATGDVFGYEALTRGPRKSTLESPNALFAVADAVGHTHELDRACFRGALRSAVGLEPVHRLFLNLLPMSFYDTAFIEREVGSLLDAAALTPANVVFEITEQLAIENFSSFRRALAGYTAMGFGVAIDDVGTRHSNLESVMALRPHFIKISDVLTRGIARSTVKREMFRSLGRIAEAIDAVVVGEGIETPDDLAVLRDLGVHYGQGFFLARPGPPFPRVRASVRRAIRALGELPRHPIAAPPADDEFDDVGEFQEHEQPVTAIRRQVEILTRHLEAAADNEPDDHGDGDDSTSDGDTPSTSAPGADHGTDSSTHGGSSTPASAAGEQDPSGPPTPMLQSLRDLETGAGDAVVGEDEGSRT